MTNIATFSASFGVTSTATQDMLRIQAEIERSTAKLTDILTTPFGEAERQVGMYEKAVANAMAKIRTGFASEKMLTDLERLKQLSQGLGQQLGSTAYSFPGSSQEALQSRIQNIIHGVGLAQQMAVPSASARYSLGGGGGIYVPGFGGGGGGPDDPNEMDLNRYFARQSFIARQGQIITNRHLKEQDERNEILRHNQFQEMAIGRYRFNEIAGFERQAADRRTTQESIAEFRQKQAAINSLAQEYLKLSAAERQAKIEELEFLRTQGVKGLSVPLQALQQAQDPWSAFNMKTGRGSWTHSARYGIQNAAFALEDYMISSQYGGVKAGLRAITNNLTAIAAASTASMNPWVSGGIIAGTAIAGAATPYLYGALTGNDEVGATLVNQFVSPRRGMLAEADRLFQSDRSIGSGAVAIRQRMEQNEHKQRIEALKRKEILRTISPEINQQGSYKTAPSEWINAFLRESYIGESGGLISGLADYISGIRPHEMAPNAGRRSLTELRQAGMAQQLREAARKQIGELEHPDIFRLQQEQDEQDRQRELRLDKEKFGSDRELSRALTEPQLERMRQYLRNPLSAAPTDPDVELAARNADRMRRREQFRRELAGDPKRLQDELTALDRERDIDWDLMPKRRAQFELDKQAHQDRLREHGFSVRQQMAGLETNPLKRLMEESLIQKDRIEADRTLTDEQRTGLLLGLAKRTRMQLDQAGRMPDLGNAIDVGSAEDVRLRQQYFGPKVKDEEKDREIWDKILKELEKMNEQLKKNAPKAAAVKK